tara:strand:- start:5225 stop:5566 length:342 start_codon:yes stop_codon:yes gene_type:complete
MCVPGPKGSITAGVQSLSNQRKAKKSAKKPSGPPPKKTSGPPPKKTRKTTTKAAPKKTTVANRRRPTKPTPKPVKKLVRNKTGGLSGFKYRGDTSISDNMRNNAARSFPMKRQ